MVNHSVSLSIIEAQFAFTRMNCISCDSFSLSLYASLLTMISHTRLDSIGIGGFSHDFGSLKGQAPPILAAFESLGSVKPSFAIMLSFVVGMIFPGLSTKIPNQRTRIMKSFGNGVRDIASELLDKATKEKAEVGAGEVDKSVIGALGEESPCVEK